jgi:hypothetical protein
MSFEGAKFFEAEVLYSNPSTHTARVRIASSTEVEPFDCCVLMPHGSGTGKSHSISMPETGAVVLVLIDSLDNAVIVGSLPKASLGTEPSGVANELDPISSKLRDTNFRGEDHPDILPGDVSIKSDTSRIHLSDSELTVRSGRARMEMSDIFGHSHIHTAAESVTHKNSLFTYKLASPGDDANPSLDINAFTQSPDRQSSLEHLNNPEEGADLGIRINQDTPLDINYAGSAAITIDSNGALLLKGSRVTIDAGGLIQELGDNAGLDQRYTQAVRLATDSSLTLEAAGFATLSGGTTTISSDNATTVSSGGTLSITAGGSSKGIPLPGIDQALAIKAPYGAVEISAGSFVPSTSSVTKPGIRLQSEGGGDIHIRSAMSPGGAFTSGSIVLDAAAPLSTSGSGGLGNYGIVLNTPNLLMGCVPGIADTPAGIPSLFAPPVPPVYDSFVKHFSHMTIYNTQLVAGISAGLAAAFGPSSAASVAAFNASFVSALATMSTPPVGRPLTCHFFG